MESLVNDYNAVSIAQRVIMHCIAIYVSVLSADRELYNELQWVTMGYKPLPGKHFDDKRMSDFPRIADDW